MSLSIFLSEFFGALGEDIKRERGLVINQDSVKFAIRS
jgi:hypothetical protein